MSGPSNSEIDEAGARLDAQRAAGWLAAVHGDYWDRASHVEVAVLRRVTRPRGDEEPALALWREGRRLVLT
jgi:hypothetical protein